MYGYLERGIQTPQTAKQAPGLQSLLRDLVQGSELSYFTNCLVLRRARGKGLVALREASVDSTPTAKQAPGLQSLLGDFDEESEDEEEVNISPPPNLHTKFLLAPKPARQISAHRG